jgi:hypothetical protein
MSILSLDNPMERNYVHYMSETLVGQRKSCSAGGSGLDAGTDSVKSVLPSLGDRRVLVVPAMDRAFRVS